MYRCNICGSTGEKPGPIYEEDCVTVGACRSCGSPDIRISPVSCRVCGEPIFEGEDAYRIKEKIICRECVTEITV